MFQFPGFALLTLCIQVRSSWFTRLSTARGQTIVECQVGFPIRKFMDQSIFSAPHDLSQSITSFIASYRQGIHQTPFSRLIRSRRRKIVNCLIENTYYFAVGQQSADELKVEPEPHRGQCIYLEKHISLTDEHPRCR